MVEDEFGGGFRADASLVLSIGHWKKPTWRVAPGGFEVGALRRLIRFLRASTLVLLAVVAAQPGRASTIFSVADYAAQPNLDFVVGIATSSSNVALVTERLLFTSGLYAPSQALDFELFSLLPGEVKLTVLAQMTSVGGGSGFSPSGDFEVVLSGLKNALYGFDLTSEALTSNVFTLGAPIPTALATSNGVLYTVARGSIYSVDSTGVAALIAADGAYVTGATTLAAGPGGLLYTVGQAVGNEGSCTAGQWCLIGIDPTDAQLASGFSLAFNAAASALVVGSDGRFYLGTGDGQGYAYAASGLQFDTLTSSAVNPEGAGGNTSLALDGDSYLYMDDAATGIHVFNISGVSTPEPSAAGTFVLGIAALWMMRKLRDRRRRIAIAFTPERVAKV